ncbi:hypothetical protein M885DRAFT_526892 [Pelagophyceae sp. CCMP2097]|nr:hypothetical protein M885DRAFT_526892 [Pelagophyceae sp. CCMP2097]
MVLVLPDLAAKPAARRAAEQPQFRFSSTSAAVAPAAAPRTTAPRGSTASLRSATGPAAPALRKAARQVLDAKRSAKAPARRPPSAKAAEAAAARSALEAVAMELLRDRHAAKEASDAALQAELERDRQAELERDRLAAKFASDAALEAEAMEAARVRDAMLEAANAARRASLEAKKRAALNALAAERSVVERLSSKQLCGVAAAPMLKAIDGMPAPPAIEASPARRAKAAATLGLPPRDLVAEPHRALMAALCRAPPPAGPCGACDGRHATAACPHYARGRGTHKDATALVDSKGASSAASVFRIEKRHAKVVRQPGDGSCLYHSLTRGLGSGSAASLRSQLADYILQHRNLTIADTPISEWVLWESGLSVPAYAQRMRSEGVWGGAIEMAVCANVRRVQVHVYEVEGTAYTRISHFVPPNAEGAKVVNVLYGGRVHYDALDLVPR